jgi:hypothetical protein
MKLEKNKLLNWLSVSLPTIIVALDQTLAVVSIIAIIAGFIMLTALGIKGQFTKHKDGIFAHLTSPSEFIKLTLTSAEVRFFWLSLNIFIGGVIAVMYLSLL